jgi:TonB family protein
MMSAYANSLQKPEGFDRYVRKFRSICMLHGVQIGSRTQLPGFMRKLVEDRHLAMDFWAFISKLSDREGGELSDDQMLGVVVEGIADGAISDEDGGQMRTVDDLRAMLAGVDIQGAEAPVEMAPFPHSKPDFKSNVQFDDEQLQQSWKQAEEPSPPLASMSGTSATDTPPTPTKPLDSQAPFTHEKLNGNVPHGPTVVLPVTPPPQLDEALLRLELTKLVQQYFDNIDKRISKLEPQGEGTIATAVTRRSLEEPGSPEESEELRLRRMDRTRLVLDPPPPPAQDSLRPIRDDDDIPMRIPLEHYSPPARFGKAPLLLVFVLIGAAFAIYRDPTLLRKGFAVVVRQLHSYGQVVSPNRSAPPAPREETSAKTEQSQPAVLQSALEGASTPSPVSAPEQTASAASRPAEDSSDSTGGRRSTTNQAVAQTEQAIADGISSIEVAGAIKVNPSIMDENLIVQRVPAYPEVAKMSRIQGDVVMQALISKEGTVKRVHVMEGDSRLRSAAEEAVYKWRYRPYVLNGRPVEVATTVTVNFNLNRSR